MNDKTDATAGESALKLQIQADMKAALKGGDKTRTAVLRLLMAAIKNAEIARQAALKDSDILGIISKEVRQREESIIAFKDGRREDLVAHEENEREILKSYLPAQLSREEIAAAARRIVAETGASSLRDKGKVMPLIIAELKGQADGRVINEVVSELLT